MIKLYGFSVSNYYQIVAVTLLEKNIPFEEVLVYPSGKENFLNKSPMNKVPCLETVHGSLCETSVIVDYLEQEYPEIPLFPSDPFSRAKMHEIIKFTELYLEWPARRLYPEAFFGGTVNEREKIKGKKAIEDGFNGLNRIVQLTPYACGDTFTAADIFIGIHVPIVLKVVKTLFDEDLTSLIPGLSIMLDNVAQRPALQHLRKQAKDAAPAYYEYIKSEYSSKLHNSESFENNPDEENN